METKGQAEEKAHRSLGKETVGQWKGPEAGCYLVMSCSLENSKEGRPKEG